MASTICPRDCDGRAVQAQTAHSVVYGFTEQPAVNAVKVIGRKASHSGERLEIERLVQVLGQVVNDALDPLRVAVGVVHHARRLTPSV